MNTSQLYFHQLVEYEPAKTFSWFPEEVTKVRREADKGPLKKQLGNVAKLKGNSFYRKMIEDLGATKVQHLRLKKGLLTRSLGLRFLTV